MCVCLIVQFHIWGPTVYIIHRSILSECIQCNPKCIWHMSTPYVLTIITSAQPWLFRPMYRPTQDKDLTNRLQYVAIINDLNYLASKLDCNIHPNIPTFNVWTNRSRVTSTTKLENVPLEECNKKNQWEHRRRIDHTLTKSAKLCYFPWFFDLFICFEPLSLNLSFPCVRACAFMSVVCRTNIHTTASHPILCLLMSAILYCLQIIASNAITSKRRRRRPPYQQLCLDIATT